MLAERPHRSAASAAPSEDEDGMGEILGLPVSKRTSPPSMGASETTLL